MRSEVGYLHWRRQQCFTCTCTRKAEGRPVLYIPSVSHAELDVGREISHVDVAELTPLSFHRDYVARNKPVIITGMHTLLLTTFLYS